MNNGTTSATSINSVVISELIQAAYLEYVMMLVNFASPALLLYTMVLAIPQEMVYMWLSPKPFSIPNLLYAFIRYAGFISQALSSTLDFLPLGSLCDNVANVQNATFVLTYIGLQGLLVTRAYSLCQGNKGIAGVLAFCFGGGLTLFIYGAITSGGCSESPQQLPVVLAENVCTIATDLCIFCVCLWKVWGTWKLKHETGIRSGNDLVSVLLKQTMLRFCFVIVISITVVIINQFKNDFVIDILSDFQHSISSILIADFTLDLRQRNSAAIQATNITLPTIQIQSVASYIHQSILMEMGDHESPMHTRAEGEDNFSMGPPDVETRREESN